MDTTKLQSKDHRGLLDVIDRLRSKGVSRYVDLPKIIVCGDQSSGKSSVLEAISGMSFPSKDNLCTRFATELILRRDANVGLSISITPDPERPDEEKRKIAEFNPDVKAQDPDLDSVVEEAKGAMGICEQKIFSTDVLRFELSGPTQPHLTMVDLPGLFRAGNKDQSIADAKVVKQMVRTFADIGLQDVTELALELDTKGSRSLGLITKPDTLPAGSDSKASYFKLAQNEDIVFRLGWHVLKNRSYETRDTSLEERNVAEKTFFASGIWTNMDPSHVGVDSLRPRLSNILKDQILQQLPSLLNDVSAGIEGCKKQLARLGEARTTGQEQQRYLLRISRDFSSLLKAAVDGVYTNPFFGSANTDEGHAKRLRANVQNILATLAQDMRERGATLVITDEEVAEEDKEHKITRYDYLSEVKALMQKSRGRALAGTFKPLIIGELFKGQCQPWRSLIVAAKDNVLKVVLRAVQMIIEEVTVDEVAQGVLPSLVQRVEDLRAELDRRVEDLLHPHYHNHPITYNHYLTDTVQKVQVDRRRRQLEDTIMQSTGHSHKGTNVDYVNFARLFDALKEETEVNMDACASELAVDYMQAYYKVAMKILIDDVSVLAIEECLMKHLPTLFDPESVHDLPKEEVERLAAESAGSTSKRTRCNERLAILEEGLNDLKGLSQHRSFHPDQEPSNVVKTGN